MLELFGSRSCPYTAQLREDLQWRRVDFVEYDVDADADAMARLAEISEADAMVPTLCDSGRVVQVGYEGRGCYTRTKG